MKRLLLSLTMIALVICAFAQSPDRMVSGKNYLNQTTSTLNIDEVKVFSEKGVVPVNRMKVAEHAADASIITEQPAGEVRTYMRKGVSLLSLDGVYVEEGQRQMGLIKTVFAQDGSVYFYEIVSAAAGGGTKSWVKGTMSADKKTITVPMKQNVLYFESKDCYIQLNMVNYDSTKDEYTLDETTKEVTFSYEEGVLRMQGTSRNHFLGLTYSDNGEWAMYGDYDTEYLLFNEVEVTPPANLKTQKFVMSAQDYQQNVVSSCVEIGFDGNDAYMKGICYKTSPKAWIKGVKQGNKLVFKSNQYMGTYVNFYPMFFVGCNVVNSQLTMADFELIYDETTKGYTTNMYVLDNIVNYDLMYLNAIHNISLSPFPEIDINTEIIRQQPEGELKTYARAGMSYYKNYGTILQDEQTGYLMKMVFAKDGKTVYMKDPITQVTAETWVKGTKEGNKITMPLYQTLDFNEQENFGVMTTRLTRESQDLYIPDFTATSMTFLIDEATGVISLEGTEKGDVIYGLVFTNNLQWNGFGDYESVYTPHNETAVIIPENLEKQNWVFSYHQEGKGAYLNVKVATDGNKMYIAGFPMLEQEAAVVGTINGNKVVFESDQYLGKVKEMEAIAYFGGAKYRIEEVEYPGFGTIKQYRYEFMPNLEFTYDKEHQILSSGENATFLINGGKPSEGIAYILPGCNPKFNLNDGKAYKPKSPEFTLYEDFSAEEGYYNVELTAPSEDVDGRFILPENLSYQIFIKKNGEVLRYTFLKSNHTKLEKDMETVPYLFSDNMTIGAGASYLYIYGTEVEDIAIEMINTTGGQEVRSKRIWAKNPDGIEEEILEGKEIKEVIYHTIDGIRVDAPVKGFNIVTTVFTDGTSKTGKMLY